MNTIHKEIAVLNCKVDALNEIVKRLNYQLQDFLTQNHPLPPQQSDSLPTSSASVAQDYSPVYQTSPSSAYHHHNPHHNYNNIDNVIDDNSVLEDIHPQENYYQHHYLPDISPDLQVQRLTAQLTAAYNRIAALEEQLLARRI